ncbi:MULTISPECIES: sulfur oxidation c-type cytochrome SoxX [unclassified Sulfitobacter]|jgi:sulfur-oxidizing protein SoxX|uniref:sulfur oxidation c-type cytochrome SoxX n=1 Tax=unclassified Sulfitobacter TaxID=196795 RepID=UPI001594982E|nr:sulfur oxidation c-type cytochrome SoxX [Sulfitobacter sp. HGT1]MBQ0804275.1 sulfur oxidation c-type cytochrome SoxX [Sulfitobacter sp.]
MRVSIYAFVASVGVATSAFAAEVAPSDVSYTDGAVEMSLTGVAGNPEEGAKIVGSKKLGNCVACHEVSALPDIAFQGLIGPALDGAGDRWSETELRGIVANAKMMFEGTMMPSFYKNTGYIRPGNAYTGKAADDTLGPLLSAQQVEDVVAYLATLKD